MMQVKQRGSQSGGSVGRHALAALSAAPAASPDVEPVTPAAVSPSSAPHEMRSEAGKRTLSGDGEAPLTDAAKKVKQDPAAD